MTARILRFDVEKERVSLSIKHMRPDPWEGIEQRYARGDRVKGRIASITDYGAFVELEPDVEGLIHITEMTWSRAVAASVEGGESRRRGSPASCSK